MENRSLRMTMAKYRLNLTEEDLEEARFMIAKNFKTDPVDLKAWNVFVETTIAKAKKRNPNIKPENVVIPSFGSTYCRLMTIGETMPAEALKNLEARYSWFLKVFQIQDAVDDFLWQPTARGTCQSNASRALYEMLSEAEELKDCVIGMVDADDIVTSALATTRPSKSVCEKRLDRYNKAAAKVSLNLKPGDQVTVADFVKMMGMNGALRLPITWEVA